MVEVVIAIGQPAEITHYARHVVSHAMPAANIILLLLLHIIIFELLHIGYC